MKFCEKVGLLAQEQNDHILVPILASESSQIWLSVKARKLNA